VISIVSLYKSLQQTVTLKKVTKTEVDSEYGLTSETVKEYSIKALINVLTEYDLRYLLTGELNVGDARGYFMKEYTVGDETVSVEVGDRIVFKGTEYDVVSVTDHYGPYGDFMYREVYMRRSS